MKIFVNELKANQTISTTFLVKAIELRTKKAGGQYVTVTFGDKTGDISGQWWDNFEDSVDGINRDDIVFVRGLVNSYRNHLQITIHRMRPCRENEIDLSHYFPTTKYDVDVMFNDLLEIIKQFENRFLSQLLLIIFADENTVNKFKKAPAAKTMHHPYLGGLLEHTLSLVRLCRKVGEHYDGIDIDLLQTGAVLHDFGKIDELSYERGFGYTNDGQMIGHLVMETIMVAEQISKIPEFPEELRRHLLHMLLAHHGKLEYGSPKLPYTPEALMLAYLDDLDSKVEAMQRLISEPHSEGDWTRISPMFDRPIYRRRTNESEPEIEESVSAASSAGAGADQSRSSKSSSKSDSFNTPFENLADTIKSSSK